MIAKAVKGRGFRGALEYDLKKEKGHIIDTNMAGETPRQLAAEFGQIRKLRPSLGKAVLHVSLSAMPGEKLSDEQWSEIGKKYLNDMGFTDNQYVITRHSDTEHEHIHIIVNRITNAGEVVSDSQDYKRQEVVMRDIEKEYGLQQVAPSRDADRKAPTKNEIERAIRTGEPSTKMQLQQLCDAAAKDCHGFTDYQDRLEAVGVELIPVTQLDGARLSGLSYRLDDVVMKGSDLGKSYAAAGIQKRGISYDKNRDFEAVRHSGERESHRTFVAVFGDIEKYQTTEYREPGRDDRVTNAIHGDADRRVTAGAESDRSSEAGKNPEHRGLSLDDRAAGAIHGDADRRDQTNNGADRQPQLGAHRDIQREDSRGGETLERSSGSDKSGSGIDATNTNETEKTGADDSLSAVSTDRNLFSGAIDRIASLSDAQMSKDRSAIAIEKQIRALDVPQFEVGIRDSKTGKMMNKEYSRAELEQSVPWLKRMNARGNDVYIRPAGDHGLILVDDVKPEQLTRMKNDGFIPAATIETSLGNFQTWIKLSDKPLSPEIRNTAARYLAKRYDGDMNSADAHHYGRLAGLTNQKPEHTKAGRQPFVLAHDCNGAVAPKASSYLDFIDQGIDKEKTAEEKARRIKAIEAAKDDDEKTVQGRKNPPLTEFQMQCQPWLKKYGDKADLSKVDFAAAKAMAQQEFSEKQIADAILKASPNIETRKVGHMEDYANRTAAKAAADPSVIEAVRQSQQERADRAAARAAAWERE